MSFWFRSAVTVGLIYLAVWQENKVAMTILLVLMTLAIELAALVMKRHMLAIERL